MKILIVDDDALSRKVLGDMLEELGQCDIVSNGIEAIDFFMRSITQKDLYDLVCLDIIMPEIDGIQVLKKIRDIEAQQSISYPRLECVKRFV